MFPLCSRFFLSRYVKKLQEEIKGIEKNHSSAKTEEEKLKIIGLKTTSNIQTLIRDLFHTPPSFKSAVHLSWVAPKQRFVAANISTTNNSDQVGAAPKRHAPITFSNGKNEDSQGPKKAKNSSASLYSPPSGKFSSKFESNIRNRPRNSGNNSRFRSGPMKNRNFRRK